MPMGTLVTDPMFYKNALEEMYDGVFIIDIARNILFWNRGAERITGYSADEVLGLNCTDELLMHLDGSGKRICDKKSCPAMDSMKTGETKEFSAYLHHKEGHRVSVSIKISSIKDENGIAAGAVVVFSDNTKLDRSIREIEKLEDQAFSDPLTRVRLLVESSSLSYDGRFIAVAVSIGGVLAGPEDTAETLIHRADEMMYKSKQAGRNRVTVEGVTFPSYDET